MGNPKLIVEMVFRGLQRDKSAGGTFSGAWLHIPKLNVRGSIPLARSNFSII